MRAQEFTEKKTGREGTLHELGKNNIAAICFPEECMPAMKMYWRMSGEIISARLAEHTLSERTQVSDGKSKLHIRKQIGALTEESLQHVALFPTGMAAFFTIHRFLQISFPERKSVRFGFSHSQSLQVQEEFGNGVHFFPKGDAEDLQKLETLLGKEKVLGIFCELPVNPLLKNIDLQRLEVLSRKYTVPIIIDDTIGTFQNREVLHFADITISNLTKFFSGAGNVNAGALILHPESRFGQMFTRVFRANFEDLFWDEDAAVLEENAKDFTRRQKIFRENTHKLYHFLKEHEAVYKVFFPKFIVDDTESFGSSGIFSFLLYRPESATPAFFDALEVSKGPDLGMNWTMVFPYLQFARTRQHDIARESGISPYIIRVSVGLEPADELIERFEKALAQIS
jgi:cystathionine gamma-synthase